MAVLERERVHSVLLRTGEKSRKKNANVHTLCAGTPQMARAVISTSLHDKNLTGIQSARFPEGTCDKLRRNNAAAPTAKKQCFKISHILVLRQERTWVTYRRARNIFQ